MTSTASSTTRRSVLATDLDGTLIPLPGSAQNLSDLKTLSKLIEEQGVTLLFVTGRHIESVEQAIEEYSLPQPQRVICDVGTSIYQRDSSGSFAPVESYYEHQDQIIAALPLEVLRRQLANMEGLRPQEQEKQGRFKLSFYTDIARLDDLTSQIEETLRKQNAPYSIIHSIDPYNGDGLIDLLPANVSKAYALEWWANEANFHDEQIIFAGDSGNDWAALTAGHRAILVGNADRQLAQRIDTAHRDADWRNRLYHATGHATSGVLEGCRWFGLAEPTESSPQRLGASPVTHDSTHFRVWAPERQSVAVEVHAAQETSLHPLAPQDDGYFTGTVRNCGPCARYRYRLDEGVSRPDPVSKYQPDGVHGVSEVVDPNAFLWTDLAWQGIAKRDLIIYELHVGTFTQEGTFRAAIERLPRLLELGITAIEIMPVAQSPGKWNWGYDGVNLFAVRNTYGTPDDFRALVDACHDAGIAVILDVVYNHLGPEGNYLAEFGPYFSKKHRTPWGEALNFDGPDSKPVRQFIIDNAIYWLDEYHLDGLRLDAVHYMMDKSMVDDSQPTILAEIRRAVTEFASTIDRTIHLIAESNIYDPELLTNDDSESYDAIWCDCLMHAIYTHALPNLQLSSREYRGAVDVVESLQHGYVYAGSTPARVTAQHRTEMHHGDEQRRYLSSLILALQTHDSVGNHPHGKRIHHLTSPAYQRAAAGLVLLYPSIPMIFMGEEVAIDAPFPFFVDFEDPQLQAAVDEGRAREYLQHEWEGALSPSDPAAFHGALCHRPDIHDAEMFTWYQALIALRKQGISAGWLKPDQMTSAYDAVSNIFSLWFPHDDGDIIVQTRLTAVEADAVSLEVASEGIVLLSSEPIKTTKNDQILIQPNHTIVSRCRGES